MAYNPPQQPNPGGKAGIASIRKRDKVCEFLGLLKSKNRNSYHSDVSQPPPQHCTRPSSMVSYTSNCSSADNQSIASSTAQTKPQDPRLENVFLENVPKPIIKTCCLVTRTALKKQNSWSTAAPCCCKIHYPHRRQQQQSIQTPILSKMDLDQTELSWLEEMTKDPMEQDHLRWLVTRAVEEFIADTTKDSTKIAEIIALAPVLQRETYRRLLASFIMEFDQARILDVAHLQGLVQLIESASPGFLEDDDLVRVLTILRRRLQATHKPASEHVYQMAVAISRLLDVMVNVMVNVNRTEDHHPLVAALNDLKDNSDPFLQFQVNYALQASQYIPDDESIPQTVLRFAGGMTMAALGVASVYKLDPANLFNSLVTLQQAARQSFEVVKSILEGLEASQQGRFGAMQSILKGIRAGTKYEWYLALLAARKFVRDGRLVDFKKTVCEAPCRDQRSFQLGVCQILGEIAMDPLRSPRIRQQAMTFLGALISNNTDWKRHSEVKQWIATSLTQISMLQDSTVSNHARVVLQDLGQDQASITPASATMFYSLSYRMPLPELSPLLARVQQIPYVEYNLRSLKKERLNEGQQPACIPPMAKASLQARDDDLYPLMDKVQDFLASKREVMLILRDSGAGKSTFNRHLEHRLWTAYHKGGPIPLLINLPAIDRPDSDLVTKQLQIHNIKDDQIQELKQHRQFILICDGYDESQLLINLHKTNRLNEQGQWHAKMVISCRTQFLGPNYLSRFAPQHMDHYKSAQLDLFQEVVIAPFSKKQVEDYVTRYVPLEPRPWVTEDYMRMLTTILNLMDLVKNPFLLMLTLEALSGLTKGQQDLHTIKVTRVQLYDHFVNMWFGVNLRRLQNSVLAMSDREVLDQLVDADFISRGVGYATSLSVTIFEQQDGNPIVQYVHFDNKHT
ncbi:hypothetical protein BGW39_007543 [Mortierella sp. 14UC]|nr:hypothetical protein BGW39_007543 [Mortierella sp. 14UC]